MKILSWRIILFFVFVFLSISFALHAHKCLFLTLFFFYPFFCLSVSHQASSHAVVLVYWLWSRWVMIYWPLTSQLHSLSYLTMSPGVLKVTPFFHNVFYNTGFYSSVVVSWGPCTICSWTQYSNILLLIFVFPLEQHHSAPLHLPASVLLLYHCHPPTALISLQSLSMHLWLDRC